MKLSDFKVLTFDVYGTLIDWESGMVAGLKPLTDQVPGLSRNDILEAHAYYESTAQRWTPARRYADVLTTVYRRLGEHWGIEVTYEDCRRYGDSVPDWPAFPDSAEALAYLKQHFMLAVLTNTDNTSFAGSNARLGVTFDGVFTAEDVGSYKPAPRNFDYMLDMLRHRGFKKHEILHVAESMFHDHVPGAKAGLSRAWIYRRHADDGYGATMAVEANAEVDFQFTSMAELAGAHKAEMMF